MNVNALTTPATVLNIDQASAAVPNYLAGQIQLIQSQNERLKEDLDYGMAELGKIRTKGLQQDQMEVLADKDEVRQKHTKWYMDAQKNGTYKLTDAQRVEKAQDLDRLYMKASLAEQRQKDYNAAGTFYAKNIENIADKEGYWKDLEDHFSQPLEEQGNSKWDPTKYLEPVVPNLDDLLKGKEIPYNTEERIVNGNKVTTKKVNQSKAANLVEGLMNLPANKKTVDYHRNLGWDDDKIKNYLLNQLRNQAGEMDKNTPARGYYDENGMWVFGIKSASKPDPLVSTEKTIEIEPAKEGTTPNAFQRFFRATAKPGEPAKTMKAEVIESPLFPKDIRLQYEDENGKHDALWRVGTIMLPEGKSGDPSNLMIELITTDKGVVDNKKIVPFKDVEGEMRNNTKSWKLVTDWLKRKGSKTPAEVVPGANPTETVWGKLASPTTKTTPAPQPLPTGVDTVGMNVSKINLGFTTD